LGDEHLCTITYIENVGESLHYTKYESF